MRKINANDFRVATRGTTREINRNIVLNLIRERQPISRASLALLMGVQRSAVTLLVGDLINEGLVREGGDGQTTTRGRKPTLLYVSTEDRFVVAIDVRFSGIYVMLSDFSGRQLALETFDPIFDPHKLVTKLAQYVNALLKSRGAAARCEGIGLAAPGMVDHHTGRILHAPMMNWRNVDLRDRLSALTKLPVMIESAPKACALSQIWLGGGDGAPASNDPRDFVYLMVSDGVGVGAVVNGELLRGHGNTAGEFGHTPLQIDGPRCLCGLNGCWEAYTSNMATLSRYYGRTLSRTSLQSATQKLTVPGLIERARGGDARAVMAVQTTARYLGLGLGTVIAALNPARIYIGGEMTAAWDLVEDTVRTALAERSLTDAAAQTQIEIVSAVAYPRLRGAVALVAAPTYAAPRVA